MQVYCKAKWNHIWPIKGTYNTEKSCFQGGCSNIRSEEVIKWSLKLNFIQNFFKTIFKGSIFTKNPKNVNDKTSFASFVLISACPKVETAPKTLTEQRDILRKINYGTETYDANVLQLFSWYNLLIHYNFGSIQSTFKQILIN